MSSQKQGCGFKGALLYDDKTCDYRSRGVVSRGLYFMMIKHVITEAGVWFQGGSTL